MFTHCVCMYSQVDDYSGTLVLYITHARWEPVGFFLFLPVLLSVVERLTENGNSIGQVM